MSLQIPIQKDIGEYDEKIVGKLTLRTLCCLALGFSGHRHLPFASIP